MPADIPYIVLPPKRCGPRGLQLLADARPGPVIGLVWSGNSATSIDRERSLTRDEMVKFLPADGVTYVRLQPGQPGRPAETDER